MNMNLALKKKTCFSGFRSLEFYRVLVERPAATFWCLAGNSKSKLASVRYEEEKFVSSADEKVRGNAVRGGGGPVGDEPLPLCNCDGRMLNCRNPELHEELQIQAAVAAGDVYTVRRMLERGYSPKIRDANGWTLLHFSAAKSKERCVRVFLEHGGQTPERPSRKVNRFCRLAENCGRW